MSFFVIYGKHNGTKCDEDIKEFKTLKEANKYSSMLWGALSKNIQKQSHIYVVKGGEWDKTNNKYFCRNYEPNRA